MADTESPATLRPYRCPEEPNMRRSRTFVSGLAILSLLLVALAGPVEAARPEPFVSRLTATTRWVTDTEGGQSWYGLWLDAYARNVRPMQYIICVKVTYSDGTQAASEGEFPRVAPRAEVMDWLQLGEVPAGASAVTVTAQAMRIGARDCCTPVGTLRIVEAPLPTRPAPPPAASEPQVVFDVTFATP